MIDLFHCLMQVIEPKCTETTKTVKRYVTETVSLKIPYFFPVKLNKKSSFPGLRAHPHPQVSDDPLSCGCYLCWYGSNNCNKEDTNGCAVSTNPTLFYRALRGILWTLGVWVETQDSLPSQVRMTSTTRKFNFPPSRTLPVCHNVSKFNFQL